MHRSGFLGPITIEESPASDDADLPIIQSADTDQEVVHKPIDCLLHDFNSPLS